ncbi:CHASE domain-containing protein [uncultured Kriegella sp.]|uniref:sensor histidine kinase n=1 Tax=uncultured Kriegella sp. TaxID=1798910 RepID=UPI0030D8D084|tara:strand:- start:214439 stop:216070 length:1632 start_codon:yes stop_codon:yes gene_type:complete
MTRRQILKYFTVLFTGVSISLYLFFAINDKFVQQKKAIVENATSKVVLRLSEEINKINLVLESMGFFFENKKKTSITQEVFEKFTDPFLTQLYGIGALEWSPKVLDISKEEYFERTERNGNNSPFIRQIGSDNQFIDAERREVYFPIELLNPVEPLRDALGYDTYSESVRKSTIDTAIATTKLSISGPIELVVKNNVSRGFLAVKAVFHRSTDSVKGIVAGVYRMDMFIEQTLASELKFLDIAIYEKSDNTLLYYSGEKIEQIETKALPIELRAANHLWEVRFVARDQYQSFPHAYESYVAAFLTLLATFLIVSLVRKRDDYNRRLEAKVRLRTAELEESNELKENLLREIHHRVKNNLQITSSLMNMQKRKLSSKEAITALEDSQARILAIALTHQKIYQDRDSKAVNLYEYLVDLMAYQKKVFPSVEYNIDCPEISIDLDYAVPLALIVSELVTNALKHAYGDPTKSNQLHIEVKSYDGEVELMVYDNGKGLPKDFDITKASGIGFEIIRSLCRQISANLSYESDEKGSRFKVAFANKVEK